MKTTAPVLLVCMVMAGAATAQTVVTVTEADCSRLVQHVPDDGVAYKPGVDVNGDAVAPADLNAAPQLAVPRTIDIPIKIDLADRIGVKNVYEAEPTVATVTWSADGRVTVNGQPITSEDQHALSKACQQIGPR